MQPPVVLWHFNRWRCEYAPADDVSGAVIVYSGDEPAFLCTCNSSEDAILLSSGLRTIAEMARQRMASRAGGNPPPC